jgi:hypothetical protein
MLGRMDSTTLIYACPRKSSYASRSDRPSMPSGCSPRSSLPATAPARSIRPLANVSLTMGTRHPNSASSGVASTHAVSRSAYCSRSSKGSRPRAVSCSLYGLQYHSDDPLMLSSCSETPAIQRSSSRALSRSYSKPSMTCASPEGKRWPASCSDLPARATPGTTDAICLTGSVGRPFSSPSICDLSPIGSPLLSLGASPSSDSLLRTTAPQPHCSLPTV